MTVVTPRNAILLSWQWVSDMVVAPLFTLAMVPGAVRLVLLSTLRLRCLYLILCLSAHAQRVQQRLDNWPQYLVYTTIACGLLWCLLYVFFPAFHHVSLLPLTCDIFRCFSEMVQLLVATCCSSPSSSTLAALAAAAATLGRPATPLAPSHSVTMLPLRILLMLFEVGIEMIAYV